MRKPKLRVLQTLVIAVVTLVLFVTTLTKTASSQIRGRQYQLSTIELPQSQSYSDIPPGFMLIEGDIVVPVEFFSKGTNIEPNSPEGTWRTSFWPNSTVPYEFDASVTTARQAIVLNAMAAWQSASNIQFVQCASNACSGAFIHIQNSTGNNSEVGFQNRRQDVNIVNWNVPTILHELGHALGYWHEQSRNDRDFFITVNYSNVQTGQNSQFDKRPSPGGEYGPYDFASIMHYDQCAFSVDCPLGASCTCTRSTITVNPPNTSWQSQIGRASNLSLWDQRVMSFLYPRPDWRFVDANHQGQQNGGFFTPFQGFTAGVQATPDGGTLWIQPSSYSAVGTYSKPMTIQAPLGGVTLGQ